MTANKQPIFPLTPKVSWNSGTITAANTAMDGASGTIYDLTPTMGENGAKIDQIVVRPLGTNTASVLRFFINNGGATTTAANNVLVHEVTLPATSASNVAALAGIDVAIAKNAGEYACPIPYLPAGYKLFCTLGTTIAAGIKVAVHYGEY